MRIPTLQGVIRRRILVNFRVDPEVMQRQLPSPIRPKLLAERAVAGICFIRLEQIRPRVVQLPVGIQSENAAHRVAVQWNDAQGERHEGVYIPRRDTSSALNHLVGGRLFPGEQQRARIDVCEKANEIDIAMQSTDGVVAVNFRARPAQSLPATSQFASLDEAAAFFAEGSLGYSATADPQRLDGVRLSTQTWHVEPLAVESVYSSYFADRSIFPQGSVAFDCALLMRNICHEWQRVPALCIGGIPE
jgi:hypothetical protein